MKKESLRMCLVCRQMKPKKELVRIVKTQDSISVDLTSKLNGRGAYICTDENCREMLKKSKALNRSFKCEVSNQVYDDILEVLRAKGTNNK